MPEWSKTVQKWLIDKQMTKKELAEALHRAYTDLVAVMSGQKKNDVMKAQILAYMEAHSK